MNLKCVIYKKSKHQKEVIEELNNTFKELNEYRYQSRIICPNKLIKNESRIFHQKKGDNVFKIRISKLKFLHLAEIFETCK